jgi:hypothetical protein
VVCPLFLQVTLLLLVVAHQMVMHRLQEEAVLAVY